jgi:hypothetical protein
MVYIVKKKRRRIIWIHKKRCVVRIQYKIEMKAEPGYVICKYACVFLDPFQRCLEIQLSSAYTYVQPLQTAPLLEIKIVVL